MAINRHLLNWSRTIHVYLSIVLLIVLVFFSITGITLNNASSMTGSAFSQSYTLDALPDLPRDGDDKIFASDELESFLRKETGIRLQHSTLSYEDEFLIVDYQAPGKAILVEIDQDFNEAFVEQTNFGLIAVLNDLHKGRHVDLIWSWLIDISAIVIVLFSMAGFVLLIPNKRRFKKIIRASCIGILLLVAGYLLGNL